MESHLKMSGERLIFDQMMEGMFIRGIGKLLTPTGKTALREAGLDMERKTLPAYPVAIWGKCLEIAAQDVYPNETHEAAMRLLGERFIEGYQDTLVGKAITPLVRIIGMKKALNRLTQSFRSGNNFMEGRILEQGQTSAHVWVNDVDRRPTWMQGVLIAGSRFMGVKEIAVTCGAQEGESCTYDMRWS